MSKNEEAKPEKAEAVSPATGRPEVTSNIKVEDFTDAPVRDPYAHDVEVEVVERDGVKIESYT